MGFNDLREENLEVVFFHSLFYCDIIIIDENRKTVKVNLTDFKMLTNDKCQRESLSPNSKDTQQ